MATPKETINAASTDRIALRKRFETGFPKAFVVISSIYRQIVPHGLQFDTCSKRGFVNEVIAGFLFLYSIMFALRGLWGVSYTHQFASAISTQYGVGDGTVFVAWIWTYVIMWLLVGAMLLRLYSSFSVFDNDRAECLTWIEPLTVKGRRREISIRIFVVIYLAAQVHFAYADVRHLRPGLLQYILYFPEKDGVVLMMREATVNLPSRPPDSIIDEAAKEIRNIYVIVVVMIELMAISLVWDLVLRYGRAAPMNDEVRKQWRKRFFIPHVLGLTIFLLCYLAIWLITNGSLLWILASWFVINVAAALWAWRTRIVIFKWLIFCRGRIAFYFSDGAQPCGND
jgi:hypothetical protein